jgi:FkbM family methyltransferase
MRVNWALHKTYVFGTHEPEIMRLLSELVKPGWTAIDVGANIGYSTLLLAKCVGAGGQVIAFEPLSENFAILQENISLNEHSNVTAENLAVMSCPGRIALRSATPGALTWVASVDIEQAAAVESQDVEAISLDEYVRRKRIGKVDFVKIDVEGAEGAVIDGMTETLKRDKPVLLVELHKIERYGENHPALLRLKEQNYRVTDLGKRNWEQHVLAEASGSPNDDVRAS